VTQSLSVPPSDATGASRPSWRALLSARELPIAIVLLVIVVAVTARQPTFLAIDNVSTLLVAVSLVVVLAMAQSVVVITRGIDVSVGSVMGMSGMTAAVMYQQHTISGLPGGVAVVLAIGCLGGARNGVLVAAAGVPAIIATLGTLGLYRAVAFYVSNGRTVSDVYLPDGVRRLSLSGPLGERTLPWIVVIALALAILTFLMLRYTRIGRHVYAVGGNADAARLRGVPVRRVTFIAYVFSGAASGLAGLLSVAHYGSVNPEQIGNGRELASIAAVAVGGVSIFGGAGSVTGVVVAALLLGTIEQALSVLGIEKGWQTTAYGAAILLAMSFDAWAGRLRNE
jgi:rhamnose transport system permease protein